MSDMTRRGFLKGAAVAPLVLKPFAAMGQQGPGSGRFDIVVAGAGHNSLITAAYLAKAGYRCVVLEGRPTIGGGVKTAELTLRGFQDDVCSTAQYFIQSNPMLRNNEIPLRDYGLEYIDPDPIMHMAFLDGSHITQWRDVERTIAEFGKFSKKDAAAYRRMYEEFNSVAPMFRESTFTPIGFGPSLPERLAAHPRGRLWQRRLAMSAWEIIKANFEDEHSRAFMVFLAHITSEAPDAPVSGRVAYTAFGQQHSGRPMPKGGSGKLAEALGRYIEARNGVILPNKWVERFIIENGRCVGVECGDGTSYRGDRAVVSTLHIKHLVDMAPRELWPQDFLDGVDTWQAEEAMFVSHYATSAPPVFPLQGGGTISPAETGLLVSPERALRVALDDACGNVNMEDPPMHCICCTVADPSRAPAGMHTLKLVTWYPYDIKQGPQHWDEIKKQVAEANLKQLRRFCPSLTPDKFLGEFIESPIDFERMNPHFWHGSAHAGAQNAAQTGPMRPMPGWAQHRMPIPGLYQTGACTYPGGSVSGAPGRNAAVVMLKDFGTSIEAVVSKKA